MIILENLLETRFPFHFLSRSPCQLFLIILSFFTEARDLLGMSVNGVKEEDAVVHSFLHTQMCTEKKGHVLG